MSKTFKLAFSAIVCLSVFLLTGCKDTAALKAALEEANKACPVKIDNVGEATAIALGNEAVEYTINPLPALVENEKADKTLAGAYLALDLQSKNPDLVKMMVDNEMGLKVFLNRSEGQPIEVNVPADQIKLFSEQFAAMGGKSAPILIQLYNQQINSQAPLQVAEGLTIKKVDIDKGKESFTIMVEEPKLKFEELRDSIGKYIGDAAEKVKITRMDLSILLPVLSELNYDAEFIYETKSGKRTFMPITSDEIKEFLTPAEEKEGEEK